MAKDQGPRGTEMKRYFSISQLTSHIMQMFFHGYIRSPSFKFLNI